MMTRTIKPNEEIIPGTLETGEPDLQEQISSHKTPSQSSGLTVLDVDHPNLGTTEAVDCPTIPESIKGSLTPFPVSSATKWDTCQ